MNDMLLWVEDDPNDILLGTRAMATVGIPTPRVVRDGQEAIAYLSGDGAYSDRSRHPLPSVILLDLKLPRVSGVEVLRWLRSQEFLRRIPVIMFTSSKEPGDINSAYDAGANAYLVKAVDFKELVELLGLIRGFWLRANRNPVLEREAESPLSPTAGP